MSWRDTPVPGRPRFPDGVPAGATPLRPAAPGPPRDQSPAPQPSVGGTDDRSPARALIIAAGAVLLGGLLLLGLGSADDTRGAASAPAVQSQSAPPAAAPTPDTEPEPVLHSLRTLTRTGLFVRTGPATRYREVGLVDPAASVTVRCWVAGETIEGHDGQADERWYLITEPAAGHVSAAWVEDDAQTVPACG